MALIRQTEDLGQIFRFNNGISLVRERENDFLEPTSCYFVDEDYRKVSPIYLSASLFNDDGVTDVIDLNNRAFMINEKFEQISPEFDEIYPVDENGVIIAKTRTKKGNIFNYYQYDGKEFVSVSPSFKDASYFKGDIAIVQDENTSKYFIVDKDFQRVSKYYDEMLGFYGNPGVVIAKNGEEKVYISSETLSVINNPDKYWQMYKLLDHDGYNPMLDAFKGYFNDEDIESASVMQDFKVALQDYLVRNIYRMGYDDVSGSFYVKHNRDGKFDKRINAEKMFKWINKVVSEAPTVAEELYMLEQGKTL